MKINPGFASRRLLCRACRMQAGDETVLFHRRRRGRGRARVRIADASMRRLSRKRNCAGMRCMLLEREADCLRLLRKGGRMAAARYRATPLQGHGGLNARCHKRVSSFICQRLLAVFISAAIDASLIASACCCSCGSLLLFPYFHSTGFFAVGGLFAVMDSWQRMRPQLSRSLLQVDIDLTCLFRSKSAWSA